MGKDQSKMATPPTVIRNSSRALELAMSPKQLNAVQEVILREYPFLESVYESMLLTDCSLPDCPIVFANDFFEKMTLYPKEEIIGRNCRFLQGPHTNPNTIKTIRAAVDNGQPLDVELLNYRKDGVPFMNCFLMLPIHKNANPKNRVTHFLAIQKDVTLLRPWEQNPADWSPSEVSMWLDKWGLIQAARLLLQANVTGAQLLRMTDETLIHHGIVKSRIRNRILEKVAHIKLDPTLAYAGKLVADSSYRSPSGGPTGTDTLKAREWWKTSPGSSSPKSSNKENNIFPEDDDEVCDLGSANVHVDDEWSDNSDSISESSSTSSGMYMTDEQKLKRLEQGEHVAIKVYFGSTIVMELIPLSMPFKKVKNLIEQKLRSRCRLSFNGGDGEFSSLTSDSDWRAAIQFTEDQVVRVIAKPKPVNISKLDCSMFDNLGSAVIVANSQSEIVFFNAVTRRLLGDISSKKNVPSLFPTLDVATYIPASWSTVEAVHRDGHSISVLLTMTESKNFLQYFVVVPSLTIAPVF